jgi:hypothetical protein
MLEWEVHMPPKTTIPKIQYRAGELRQNQTEAEAKLWSRLRAHPPSAWLEFNFDASMPSAITLLISPKGALCVFTAPKTGHRTGWQPTLGPS